MSEKPKNGHFDGLRLPEGDGIRKTRILERTDRQGRITRETQYAVASAVGAAVVLVTQEGKGDTFADYVASFQPENVRPMPTEVNRPGTYNQACSITPDGQFRWSNGSGGTESFLQMPFRINIDGTIEMIPPAITVLGPADTFIENFAVGPYEFVRDNNNLYRYEGVTETLVMSASFIVNSDTPYITDDFITLSADSGITRGGLTRDTGEIAKLAAGYGGPPLPIRTRDEFWSRDVAIPIAELNPLAADPAAALLQSSAIFGRMTGHAFVTEICRRGAGNCTRPPDQNTSDIFMYDRDLDTNQWIPASKTRVASRLDRHEGGSCIYDGENAEVIFLEFASGGMTQLFYVTHCKDPDDDDVHNCRGDNCPVDANADQSNLDGDVMGDACDPCPRDATNDASDLDGICDDEDNCVGVSNVDQSDRDIDRIGDACDTCPDDSRNDEDGDIVCGNVDNCPTVPNPGQENTYGDARGDACEPPPVMDAGMEGGIDGGRDAGMEGGTDAGTDAGADGNPEAGTDAGMDAQDAGRDAGIDAMNDVNNESTDAGVDGHSDVADENYDAHDGGRTEISVPPKKPGCSCNVPNNSVGALDVFQMSLVAVAVIQGIRRRIFGKKKVNAKP